MKELIATIHFLGLALFSDKVPEQPGLYALLPRVHDSTTHRIEPHVAALVFAQRDLRQVIGCDTQPAPEHLIADSVEESAGEYRMVRLNDEHVSFFTFGDNAAVDFRTDEALPKLACGRSFEERLSYAARVSLPRGAVSSCSAPRNRFDTRLQLHNSGDLQISVQPRNGGTVKTLILAGDATVYVVNVPALHHLEHHDMNSTEHFLAYYNLVKPTSPDCLRALMSPPAVPPCPQIALQLRDGEMVSRDGSITIPAVNSECSNSAWP